VMAQVSTMPRKLLTAALRTPLPLTTPFGLSTG
jgi:hypothetical protein